MGDTFFSSFYPIIDLESGGSIAGMIAAADKALPWIDANTKVIPGHGAIGDRSTLVEFRAMLVGVRDAVLAGIKKKKGLAEIQAMKPTTDWDEKWGQGSMKPDRFVELVYNDLTFPGHGHPQK